MDAHATPSLASASRGLVVMMSYLERHAIAPMLDGIVNELAREQPDDPISFLINGLLQAAAARGSEPVLVQRMNELKLTLIKDQEAALATQTEARKLKYRVNHLNRTLDEMEKQGPDPASATSAPAADVGAVPIGHTPYSWAGGVELAAPAPTGGASAVATSTKLERCAFSDRVQISHIFDAGAAAVGQKVSVSGWARTIRIQKGMGFAALNDGSTLANLQLVLDKSKTGGWAEIAEQAATGCAICAVGELVASPAAGQAVELAAASVRVVGPSDGATYPLAKKAHTLEHLRTITHMRPRTNTIGAVMRVRNTLAYAAHTFFHEHGFMYVNSPLITGSDCEGAGEMFQVTTLDLANVPKLPGAKGVDYSKDFFGRSSYLTVSGQLNAEHYACAFGSVYTFGPTFRAEDSNTTRHLAEFWMIEPEIAFADLTDDMNCAEAFLTYCLKKVLGSCADDLAFLAKHYDAELINKLQHVTSTPFARVTYTEAIQILSDAKGVKWEHPPTWGKELQTEHEKYLAEVTLARRSRRPAEPAPPCPRPSPPPRRDAHAGPLLQVVFERPVIVYNYPKDCKAFYMRLNDDDKTVAAMDVLFPKLGEMVGGSQREERLDVLLKRMEEMELKAEDYDAYLDLRRYGTQKHAGFGVGFERLVTYATGMGNIRDVIPFPRAPGQLQH